MLNLLTLLLVVGVPICAAQNKVKVDLHYEAGCPFSYKFISGVLKKAFDAPGFLDMIQFDGHPFGNAYFVTSKCGGGGAYNIAARKCFESQCGSTVAAKPAECFTGDLVCQHGEAECRFNRAEACVKSLGASPKTQVDFFDCIYPQAGSAANTHTEAQLVSTCATQVGGFDKAAMEQCFNGVGSPSGAELIKTEAGATPVHPAVPYVIVNGQPIDDHDQIVQAVCAESTAPAQPLCSQAAATRKLGEESPIFT